MSEIQLIGRQREVLRVSLAHPPSTGYARRAMALLALDGGQSVAEVAELLGVSRQSIYNWVRAYAQSPRPDALRDRYGVGRPSLWTEPLEQLLHQGLGKRPDDLGYGGVNWTVPLLREYLADETGCWLSPDTIRRHLQRLGYVWKRYRYVLPPDLQREKKTRHPPAPGPLAAAQCGTGGG